MKEVLENLNERLLLEWSASRSEKKTSMSSNEDFFPSSSPISSIYTVEFEAIFQVFSFSRRAIKRNVIISGMYNYRNENRVAILLTSDQISLVTIGNSNSFLSVFSEGLLLRR